MENVIKNLNFLIRLLNGIFFGNLVCIQPYALDENIRMIVEVQRDNLLLFTLQILAFTQCLLFKFKFFIQKTVLIYDNSCKYET